MQEVVDRVSVKSLLLIASGLQVAILVVLVSLWTQTASAADWSKAAAAGTVAAKKSADTAESAADKVKDYFDRDGTVKCRALPL